VPALVHDLPSGSGRGLLRRSGLGRGRDLRHRQLTCRGCGRNWRGRSGHGLRNRLHRRLSRRGLGSSPPRSRCRRLWNPGRPRRNLDRRRPLDLRVLRGGRLGRGRRSPRRRRRLR
jgi:hypothetical protein